MRFSPTAHAGAGVRACVLFCVMAMFASTVALAQQSAPPSSPTPSESSSAEPYGWPWLVRALDRLKPSVDTSLPETPSQVATRLENAISQGQSRQALAEIDQIERQREQSGLSGVDARLLFLKGRALAAQGDLAGAQSLYQNMTTRFPELPEPWNNLAAVQVAQGQPEAALHSLQMALMTDPGYAMAKANIADVYLMLAVQHYRAAAEQGVAGTNSRAQQVRQIIEGK